MVQESLRHKQTDYLQHRLVKLKRRIHFARSISILGTLQLSVTKMMMMTTIQKKVDNLGVIGSE